MTEIKHQPKSLEELKGMREPTHNLTKTHRENLTWLERIAVWISSHIGTMEFFLLIFIWTLGWLSWNTLGPGEFRFDPFPAFVLWLFISNTIQIFLMPLILIGQNLQEKRAEAMAEADYRVNKRAEREIEAVLMHLENQHKENVEILERLERLEKK